MRVGEGAIYNYSSFVVRILRQGKAFLRCTKVHFLNVNRRRIRKDQRSEVFSQIKVFNPNLEKNIYYKRREEISQIKIRNPNL